VALSGIGGACEAAVAQGRRCGLQGFELLATCNSRI